ncbi:MAG: universal stress protein [Deltaproteobacteria bacterium]|nr:universal stress protein [Deltaproteobacteria bacterium]
MAFTKILCPIDFSAGSKQALRAATGLARTTGAELLVVHAWHIPAIAFAPEAPLSPAVVQGLVDESQRALDAAVADALAGGAQRVRGKLRSGVPWRCIVDELEAEASDVCVIGTHGRTGLARVLLGSVATQVVRHAPCAVLVVRPDGESAPFRHALVPTDFSPSAVHALDLATALVAPGGAITLLHVIEVPVSYAGEVTIADFARDLDQRAAAAVEREAARIAGPTVAVRTRIGYPGAQTLAALDDDRTIDLVVMGSHGRTGIARALLGSVAEKVVRHARCPVLVARDPTTRAGTP